LPLCVPSAEPCVRALMHSFRKERREKEQFVQRLTGKQIYAQRRLGSTADDEEEDEGAQEVDISKYEREQNRRDEEDEENGLVYSDSD